MKIVLFLTVIAGLLIAQTKMKPAPKAAAKPPAVAIVHTPAPPRTELTDAEKIALIDSQLQYEKAAKHANDLAQAIQVNLDNYKASHNAKDCKGLSPGMQWTGCEPPPAPAQK